jgi:hypothetical protein
MRKCEVCGEEIPAGRLEALPDTRTCVKHSTVKGYVGYMVSDFSKGTAPALVMVDPDDEEAMRRAKRANRRNR